MSEHVLRGQHLAGLRPSPLQLLTFSSLYNQPENDVLTLLRWPPSLRQCHYEVQDGYQC